MFPEAKVIRLGKIANDLRKKVTKLEEQIRPSTPPEVLEERTKAAAKATKKIEEAEALCSKVIDQVSRAWEALIEDAEPEKVVDDICTAKIEVTHKKNEMK